jgi:hypothetical protein
LSERQQYTATSEIQGPKVWQDRKNETAAVAGPLRRLIKGEDQKETVET